MKFLFTVTIALAVLTSIPAKVQETSPAEFVTAANSFVDLLVAKTFVAAVAQFDDTMKTALPQPKLEETWSAVQSQAGVFKKKGKVRTEQRGAFTVVFVTCDFERMPLDVKVVFDKSKRVAGLFFSPVTNVDYTTPPYVKADAFREKEVVVGDREWALPGTLTIPTGNGLFAAVVLVHGSGPNDRDETIGPNKPFKDLAWGLAANGIAVLRYEKRTRQHPSKLASVKHFTVKEETIDDAIAAVNLLSRSEAIDRRRIFVLGHSLGGMLVPRIASRESKIAGVILLAGATSPLEKAIPEQLQYLFSLDGSVSPEEQKQLDDAKTKAAQVKALTHKDIDSRTPIFGAPASYWLDLRSYDPPAVAHELKQPMLILQGERDYQVTMREFGAWKSVLGAKDNVTFKSYPALNHLFIAGKGKSGPAEYEVPGHVDGQVVADIAAWIKSVR